MAWACGCCEGKRGDPVLVPYMPPRSEQRQLQPFCSYCDRMDLWPVYTRTSPRT